MTSELFEQWARKLYRIPSGKARNISLLVDNCHARPEVSNLKKVKLIFIPPNTTFMLQRMDQGVIRSVKAQYRGQVVQMCIKA